MALFAAGANAITAAMDTPHQSERLTDKRNAGDPGLNDKPHHAVSALPQTPSTIPTSSINPVKNGKPKYKVCKEESCQKRSERSTDGQRVYCKGHMRLHNLVPSHKLCQVNMCTKRAQPSTNGERLYCKAHMLENGLQHRERNCQHEACDKRAQTSATGLRTYCKRHMKQFGMQPRLTLCKVESCPRQVQYSAVGKTGYCTSHMKEFGMAPRTQLCQAPACSRHAVASSDGKTMFCRAHIMQTGMKPKQKACQWEGCNKRAQMCMEGLTEYCKVHMRQVGREPKEPKCQVEGCSKRAQPGPDVARRYCKSHQRAIFQGLRIKVEQDTPGSGCISPTSSTASPYATPLPSSASTTTLQAIPFGPATSAHFTTPLPSSASTTTLQATPFGPATSAHFAPPLPATLPCTSMHGILPTPATSAHFTTPLPATLPTSGMHSMLPSPASSTPLGWNASLASSKVSQQSPVNSPAPTAHQVGLDSTHTRHAPRTVLGINAISTSHAALPCWPSTQQRQGEHHFKAGTAPEHNDTLLNGMGLVGPPQTPAHTIRVASMQQVQSPRTLTPAICSPTAKPGAHSMEVGTPVQGGLALQPQHNSGDAQSMDAGISVHGGTLLQSQQNSGNAQRMDVGILVPGGTLLQSQQNAGNAQRMDVGILVPGGTLLQSERNVGDAQCMDVGISVPTSVSKQGGSRVHVSEGSEQHIAANSGQHLVADSGQPIEPNSGPNTTANRGLYLIPNMEVRMAATRASLPADLTPLNTPRTPCIPLAHAAAGLGFSVFASNMAHATHMSPQHAQSMAHISPAGESLPTIFTPTMLHPRAHMPFPWPGSRSPLTPCIDTLQQCSSSAPTTPQLPARFLSGSQIPSSCSSLLAGCQIPNSCSTILAGSNLPSSCATLLAASQVPSSRSTLLPHILPQKDPDTTSLQNHSGTATGRTNNHPMLDLIPDTKQPTTIHHTSEKHGSTGDNAAQALANDSSEVPSSPTHSSPSLTTPVPTNPLHHPPPSKGLGHAPQYPASRHLPRSPFQFPNLPIPVSKPYQTAHSDNNPSLFQMPRATGNSTNFFTAAGKGNSLLDIPCTDASRSARRPGSFTKPEARNPLATVSINHMSTVQHSTHRHTDTHKSTHLLPQPLQANLQVDCPRTSSAAIAHTDTQVTPGRLSTQTLSSRALRNQEDAGNTDDCMHGPPAKRLCQSLTNFMLPASSSLSPLPTHPAGANTTLTPRVPPSLSSLSVHKPANGSTTLPQLVSPSLSPPPSVHEPTAGSNSLTPCASPSLSPLPSHLPPNASTAVTPHSPPPLSPLPAAHLRSTKRSTDNSNMTPTLALQRTTHTPVVQVPFDAGNPAQTPLLRTPCTANDPTKTPTVSLRTALGPTACTPCTARDTILMTPTQALCTAPSPTARTPCTARDSILTPTPALRTAPGAATRQPCSANKENTPPTSAMLSPSYPHPASRQQCLGYEAQERNHSNTPSGHERWDRTAAPPLQPFHHPASRHQHSDQQGWHKPDILTLQQPQSANVAFPFSSVTVHCVAGAAGIVPTKGFPISPLGCNRHHNQTPDVRMQSVPPSALSPTSTSLNTVFSLPTHPTPLHNYWLPHTSTIIPHRPESLHMCGSPLPHQPRSSHVATSSPISPPASCIYPQHPTLTPRAHSCSRTDVCGASCTHMPGPPDSSMRRDTHDNNQPLCGNTSLPLGLASASHHVPDTNTKQLRSNTSSHMDHAAASYCVPNKHTQPLCSNTSSHMDHAAASCYVPNKHTQPLCSNASSHMDHAAASCYVPNKHTQPLCSNTSSRMDHAAASCYVPNKHTQPLCSNTSSHMDHAAAGRCLPNISLGRLSLIVQAVGSGSMYARNALTSSNYHAPCVSANMSSPNTHTLASVSMGMENKHGSIIHHMSNTNMHMLGTYPGPLDESPRAAGRPVCPMQCLPSSCAPAGPAANTAALSQGTNHAVTQAATGRATGRPNILGLASALLALSQCVSGKGTSRRNHRLLEPLDPNTFNAPLRSGTSAGGETRVMLAMAPEDMGREEEDVGNTPRPLGIKKVSSMRCDHECGREDEDVGNTSRALSMEKVFSMRCDHERGDEGEDVGNNAPVLRTHKLSSMRHDRKRGHGEEDVGNNAPVLRTHKLSSMRHDRKCGHGEEDVGNTPRVLGMDKVCSMRCDPALDVGEEDVGYALEVLPTKEVSSTRSCPVDNKEEDADSVPQVLPVDKASSKRYKPTPDYVAMNSATIENESDEEVTPNMPNEEVTPAPTRRVPGQNQSGHTLWNVDLNDRENMAGNLQHDRNVVHGGRAAQTMNGSKQILARNMQRDVNAVHGGAAARPQVRSMQAVAGDMKHPATYYTMTAGQDCATMSARQDCAARISQQTNTALECNAEARPPLMKLEKARHSMTASGGRGPLLTLTQLDLARHGKTTCSGPADLLPLTQLDLARHGKTTSSGPADLLPLTQLDLARHGKTTGGGPADLLSLLPGIPLTSNLKTRAGVMSNEGMSDALLRLFSEDKENREPKDAAPGLGSAPLPLFKSSRT